MNPEYGILTDQDIKSRLEGNPGDIHTFVIAPRPKEIRGDSIDLRLGSCFFVPRAHRSPCFIPGLTNASYLYSEQYVPYGSCLVVPAHHTVLGSTLEYIKLPSDVSGKILTKSSWARTFITIETAPWIHPLYRGCLTLEIANVSNTPVVLYPGVEIAQLILLRTMHDTRQDGHGQASGRYIGPVRPEPAQLEGPQKSLETLAIGLHDMVYPLDDCFEHREFRQNAADHCFLYEDFHELAADYLRNHGYTVQKLQ
jgi:dCTP deaminase